MANRSDASDALIEIKIIITDSQTYHLSISNQRRVRNLKEDIALLIGMPIEQQRLIYCGKVLMDDQVISSYNVQHGDALHLVCSVPSISSNGSSSSRSGASHSTGTDGISPGTQQEIPNAAETLLIRMQYDLYLAGLQQNNLVPTSSVDYDDLPEFIFPTSADIRQQNNAEHVHGEENNRNSLGPSQNDFIPDGDIYVEETVAPGATTENDIENMGTDISSGPSTVEHGSAHESSIEPSDENNRDSSSTR